MHLSSIGYLGSNEYAIHIFNINFNYQFSETPGVFFRFVLNEIFGFKDISFTATHYEAFFHLNIHLLDFILIRNDKHFTKSKT